MEETGGIKGGEIMTFYFNFYISKKLFIGKGTFKVKNAQHYQIRELENAIDLVLCRLSSAGCGTYS